MRSFFLGDSKLDSCGIGAGRYGYVCVCGKCGKAWGRVEGLVNCGGFIPLTLPCPDCPGYSGQIPGSFMQPLIWWDYPNGKDLNQQLGAAGEKLLRHEALMAARAVLKKVVNA